MRITIGGALVMVGTGAFVALGPLRLVNTSSMPSLNVMDSTEKAMEWAMGLFKGNQGAVEKTTELPPLPVVETKVLEPVQSAPPAVEAPAAPVDAYQPVKAAAPTEKPVIRKKQRRSRNVTKSQAGVMSSAPVAAKAAPPVVKMPAKAKSTGGKPDALVGVYVSLKLKTGREVKGVLQEKSATHYTLELPGMGPFQYPINNVISVKQAE